jgi:hypothetical protein
MSVLLEPVLAWLSRIAVQRVKVGIDALGLTIEFAEGSSERGVDARIASLERIRIDLLAAADAVQQLEGEARVRQGEVKELRAHLDQLRGDRETAEAVLRVKQDNLSRLLNNATRSSARRGILLGAVLGLVSGFVSSYAVWWRTR